MALNKQLKNALCLVSDVHLHTLKTDERSHCFQWFSMFLAVCQSVSCTHSSDRCWSVFKELSLLAEKNRPENRDDCLGITWRLPTRGLRGRGSLFLQYWLGIVCHSSWMHHVLLTCFFQSRGGAGCCFSLSSCDLVTFEQKEENTCRACRAKSSNT